jgi:hypothetical protein
MLPGYTTKDHHSSNQQALVIIAGDELYAPQIPGNQVLQKGSPVDFKLTQRS